jgi:hypothetical protein
MLNGNGSLDTQTHRLIQAWVTELPTDEIKALLDPPTPPITGMHQVQRPYYPQHPRDAGSR